MLLSLKKEIIYGPVNSRRLGVSLGINVLPGARKTCTLDCVYCQYGWTPEGCLESRSGRVFPSVDDVCRALVTSIKALERKPSYFTFSGNGEPTLHPNFGLLVDEVNRIRNKHSPASMTAVLSNSTMVNRPEIRLALQKLDVRIMKLDCGTADRFEAFNKPIIPQDLNDLTLDLGRLRSITIQTLLAKGKSGNMNESSILAWLKRLARIKPDAVQIYTLDRDYPARDLEPAKREDMEKIKEAVRSLGFNAAVF